MSRYHVYLEENSDGTCLAHVPDLAGCVVAGGDRASALVAVPDAIRAYIDWCGRHGDPVPEDGVIGVAVAEVVQTAGPSRRGGVNALFSADRAPLGDAELRTYLRRMGYARSDLLALVRALPPAALDAPPADGHDTVRQILAHIASTEAWYLSRLGQRMAADGDDGDISRRLIDSRSQAVGAILRLSPRQRDLVYIPTEHPSADPEEGWTLRKLLRRFLEHELMHLHALRESPVVTGGTVASSLDVPPTGHATGA